MATSAEQDDHDDKEAATPSDEGGGDEKPTADAKPASKGEVKASSEPEEEGDEAPRKVVAKPVAKGAGAKRAGGGKGSAKGRTGGRAPSGQQGSSLGKSMVLFVLIIGGLAVGFALLGRDEQQAAVKPKWTVGQTVDIELWLQKSDSVNLACAAADEVAGKHCAFEAKDKAWSKGDNDDKKLLRPYTATDGFHVAAAGIWSQPALALDKIPDGTSKLKCKFKVEGTLKKIAFRWKPTDPWGEEADWSAGTTSDCHFGP